MNGVDSDRLSRFADNLVEKGWSVDVDAEHWGIDSVHVDSADVGILGIPDGYVLYRGSGAITAGDSADVVEEARRELQCVLAERED